MAETSILRSSASARQTANTSATPAVQLSGAHRMVEVQMGSGGIPQLAGAAHPNVSLGRQTGQRIASQSAMPPTGTALSSPLPMIQINMNNGRPTPAGGQQQARNVVLLPPKNQRLPNGGSRQLVAPAPSRLSGDQLLLCRHLVGEYLKSEGVTPENAELAEKTLASIEIALIDATSTPAPARVVVSAGPKAAQNAGAVAPRRVTRIPPPPVAPISDIAEARERMIQDVETLDGEVCDVDSPESEV
jgi:hypothetical protein